MKKKRIKIDQLTLDKETISRLNNAQLREVDGGAGTVSCNKEEMVQEVALNSCCATSCTQ